MVTECDIYRTFPRLEMANMINQLNQDQSRLKHKFLNFWPLFVQRTNPSRVRLPAVGDCQAPRDVWHPPTPSQGPRGHKAQPGSGAHWGASLPGELFQSKALCKPLLVEKCCESVAITIFKDFILGRLFWLNIC